MTIPDNITSVKSALAGGPLDGIGDLDPLQAGEAFRAMINQLQLTADHADLLGNLLDKITESADSRMAFNNLLRFIEATPDRSTVRHQLLASPHPSTQLIALMSGSQFLSDVLVSQPDAFDWLLSQEALYGARPADYYKIGIDTVTSGLSDRSDQRAAISRWRRREYLRIGLRDLLLVADAEDVSRDISDLAEAIIDKAAQIVYGELATRFGEPIPEGISSVEGHLPVANKTPASASVFGSGMCVLGMGKLGGRELNFSSDIDLIFVYEDEGQTAGRLDGTRRIAIITNHDFFTRMGEQLVRFLGERGPEGNLFRVDMRLRPEGADGPLARSLESFIHYLNSQARDWERLAYLKARVVSGPPRLAEKLYRVMSPFVYAGLEAQRIVSEIQELKLRIDREVIISDVYKREVKRGYGGIREIEFVVAAMQIIHGYHHHALRVRNTFLAIQRLLDTHIISADAAEFYQYAYSFLRTVEHRLQMAQEAQIHTLPPPGPEFAAMAHRSGFLNSADFQHEYERITDAVHKRFTEFFQRDTTAVEQASRDIITILDRSTPPADSVAALQRRGLHDPDALRLIHILAYGTRDVFVSAEGQKSFEQMLPALLRLTAAAPLPGQVFSQFHSFALAIKGITYYYEVIAQHPDILKLLVTLFGTSESLSSQLIAHPEFFDSLISTRILNESDIDGAFRTERMASVRSIRRFERRFTILRRVTHFERLVLALQYLLKLRPLQDCLADLSFTADVALGLAVELAAGKLLAKWNSEDPVDNAQVESFTTQIADTFTIIGLGKYGGKELNFYGDLDVVFAYDASKDIPAIARARLNSKQEFYDTLADAVLSAIGEQMTGGKAFEIDPRLRPHGRNAPLTVELQTYRDYLTSTAETWELQSFHRARCVWGSIPITRLLQQSWAVAIKQIQPEALASEIRDMRGRLEESVADSTSTIELKRSPGGVVDVEFLLQYLALTGAIAQGPQAANYFVALDQLTPAVMGDKPAAELQEAYALLRNTENTIRLVTGSTASAIAAGSSAATAVARSMGYATVDELIEQLTVAKELIRKMFNNTLTSQPG